METDGVSLNGVSRSKEVNIVCAVIDLRCLYHHYILP